MLKLQLIPTMFGEMKQNEAFVKIKSNRYNFMVGKSAQLLHINM